MFRTIILFLLCQLCIEGLYSQNELSTSLLKIEQEIYNSESDTITNDLILQKIDLYIENNNYSTNVLQEIKRVNFSYLNNDSTKSKLFWNASIIAYFNDDIFYSLHYFEEYEKISKDTTVEKELLKILIYKNYNSLYSSELIQNLTQKNSKFQCLECLKEVEEYEMKNKRFKQKIAFFIPGMGLILNGNILKGTTSVVLNTSTILAIRWMFQNNLYLNMVGWGSNMIVKFYVGNINLTSKMIDKKEGVNRNKKAIECSDILAKLLNEYPLNYK